jgi:hypothetical protein
MTTPIEYQLKLPAQIMPEHKNTTSFATRLSEFASVGSVLGNILIGIILYQSLNMLFSMVGSLQYILYLSILNTNFPGNANMVFEVLLSIMTFDIVPDSFTAPWFSFVTSRTSNEDISDKFN